MGNIKSKTIKGVLWNLTERLGNQIIRFCLGIILARLLMPSDYGIIALTTIIIAFSEIIADGGFMMVLIQRRENTDREYSTVFWSKLISASIIVSIIFFLAPLVAGFYDTSILKNVLRLISLSLVINAFCSVHKIRLTVDLDFKGQAKIILLSTVIGGCLGIVLALKGYGVWSLVFQTLIISAVQVVLFWLYTKWIPRFSYSYSFVKSIFGNSLYFLFANILTVLYNNLYITTIGKIYNPSLLGLYTRARQFEQLPENTANSIIVKVLFPVLTANKDNKKTLKDNTIQILSWLSFIITPIMFLLIVNAKQIIIFFLTEKWIGAVDFLIILAVAGFFIPINNALLNIFNVLGKPKISTRIYVIKILLSAFLILIVWKYGVLFTAAMIILENIIVFIVLSFITKNLINLNLIDIINSIGGVIVINLIVFAFIYYLLNYIDIMDFNNVVHMVISFVSYMSILYSLGYLFKLPQVKYINTKIKGRF
ncbi:lipopolysaccharide biosynthesis protein [Winogradskyella sp.]|uniref:lipopolysaccharide biosynthesis protein n=1 Tax=Winogradskyella sp. TaxID=1883156 RepID=UPI001B005E30|nr:lipopolysaccharide biosynthesis protein [Winogradskyella sp.]MBO6881103.1 lipopolysaccharide biosynthesis protein [Winogradskyella sp.]